MPHSDHYIHAESLKARKRKRIQLFKKKLSPFDKVVLVVSILYPMSALPQAITVLQGSSEGVSIISWLSFMVCAVLFFVYGVKNKVFPMIISNFLWIVMDGLVVLGIVYHSQM